MPCVLHCALVHKLAGHANFHSACDCHLISPTIKTKMRFSSHSFRFAASTLLNSLPSKLVTFTLVENSSQVDLKITVPFQLYAESASASENIIVIVAYKCANKLCCSWLIVEYNVNCILSFAELVSIPEQPR